MNRLTILYDVRCGFCIRCAAWLMDQPQLITIETVPLSSPLVASRYPTLRAAEELVVIADDSAVYRGTDAWIMALYALTEYREWSLRLASPALKPFARNIFEMVSKQRRGLSRIFGYSNEQLVRYLSIQPQPSCEIRSETR